MSNPFRTFIEPKQSAAIAPSTKDEKQEKTETQRKVEGVVFHYFLGGRFVTEAELLRHLSDEPIYSYL